MKLISVCVPASALTEVKEAMFSAGAGRSGHYDRCCRETPGFSEFRPLPGSNPAHGRKGDVCRVEDFRLEMICENSLVPAVMEQLKKAHPYEEPACSVQNLEN